MEHTLTSDQIRWAASHDWFGRDNGDGTIMVIDRAVAHIGGCAVVSDKSFCWRGGFCELRAWAGY